MDASEVPERTCGKTPTKLTNLLEARQNTQYNATKRHGCVGGAREDMWENAN